MKFQPVVKWSGSKRSQSETIVSKIERKQYNTYYEPFCGGCSILFQILHSDIEFKNYICSDINKGLIDLWKLIKSDPKLVIDTYTTREIDGGNNYLINCYDKSEPINKYYIDRSLID